MRIRVYTCVWYTKSCVRACAARWLKRHFEKDRQHGRCVYYTPTAVLTHTALLCCAARARVRECIRARSRIFVRVCVCVCATGDRVLCVHYVVVSYPAGQGCSDRAAQRATGDALGGRHAKRPAPRPTVYDGWPPRERGRNARPTIAAAAAVAGRSRSAAPIAASARILDTLGQPRADPWATAAVAAPFCTGGGGVPPPAALRRAVFHRCVRIIVYAAETSSVRAWVRACSRTYDVPFR